MFERFTEGARHSLFFARLSAAEYASPLVETEHFLLGILCADPNVIGRFLPSKTDKDIRADVERRIPKENASTSIDIPLSNPCKRILAYAAEEAERLRHYRIDVGHLLIGVVREEDGVASQILRSAGFNVVDMRQQMVWIKPPLSDGM
jgi:ATP-dependent Clp protease ATP-binding subunit ClpC